MFFTNDILTSEYIKFSLNVFLGLYKLCDNKKNTLLQCYSKTLNSFTENKSNYFINLHNLLLQFRQGLDDINFCVEKSNSIVIKCTQLQENFKSENKDTFIDSVNFEIEENYTKILDKLSLVDIFISDTLLKNSTPDIPHLLIPSEKIKKSLKANNFKTINKELINTDKQKKDIIPEKKDIIPEKKEQKDFKEVANTVTINKNTKQTVPEFSDNDTLLISDSAKKVFLPYTLSNVKKILENNSSYSNIQEVIDDNYVIPLNRFKNSTVSRFKEGYTLMKEKENKKVISSIELGLELAFNNNLNPAIITACNNLSELDTYLDYLDENETDKFPYFKIKYDIKPL